ncbi:MAG TPA: hypothetical protein V6D07_18610 [Trichocoleus sp.]
MHDSKNQILHNHGLDVGFEVINPHEDWEKTDIFQVAAALVNKAAELIQESQEGKMTNRLPEAIGHMESFEYDPLDPYDHPVFKSRQEFIRSLTVADAIAILANAVPKEMFAERGYQIEFFVTKNILQDTSYWMPLSLIDWRRLLPEATLPAYLNDLEEAIALRRMLEQRNPGRKYRVVHVVKTLAD